MIKLSTIYNLSKTGIFFLFISLSLQSFSQKNDTVYFLNGDRISGEIKQYKYGFLSYKTYGVGTVQVKYDKLSTFYSNKSFDILLSNGIRRFGSFDSSRLAQTVKIITMNDTIMTPIIEIVEIVPINSGFWQKMSGLVDVGYSFSKANSLSQLSASSNIRYVNRKYQSDLKINFINTTQEETNDVKNKDASLGMYRLLNHNWFVGTNISGEQNSELGLNLRIQNAWLAGNELIHTNSNNLLVFGGLVVNKEFSGDSSFSQWNMDAATALSYRLFRFQDPEINVTSQLTVYPSLTVAGRYRINYNISSRVEIVSDMYFKLSFVDTYDSKPTSTNAANNDFYISTSIGYSF